MKAKLISLALIMLLFVSCAERPQGSPTERATALLSSKKLSSDPIITLDTVWGYDESHKLNIAAINLKWQADSIILNQRGQKRLLNPKEQQEIRSLASTIYALQKQSADEELKNRLQNKSIELVGFRYAFADSLTGRISIVYFDKEVTKITGIDRYIDE